MPLISFDDKFITDDIRSTAGSLTEDACDAWGRLEAGSCEGHEWTGWYDYPKKAGFDETEEIDEYVKNCPIEFDIVVVIGIGGSYLGTRAVADSLSHAYIGRIDSSKCGYRKPLVFAGHHLSEAETLEILDLMDGHLPIINVISKSGKRRGQNQPRKRPPKPIAVYLDTHTGPCIRSQYSRCSQNKDWLPS